MDASMSISAEGDDIAPGDYIYYTGNSDCTNAAADINAV